MSASSARDYVTAELGDGVRACTTTRAGGVSSGSWGAFNLATHVNDEADAVARNRQLLAMDLGVERFQWLNQVHGVQILCADRTTAQAVPDADAMFTTEQSLALAVLTADCLPVVLMTDKAVGVAHCGWRGLAARLLPLLAAEMPGTLRSAWLGPGICGGCYQVDETLLAEFDARDLYGHDIERAGRGEVVHDSLTSAVTQDEQEGKVRLSLPAIAANQLTQLGCEQLVASELCSLCDERFYSYRREAVTGRIATVAWRD